MNKWFQEKYDLLRSCQLENIDIKILVHHSDATAAKTGRASSKRKAGRDLSEKKGNTKLMSFEEFMPLAAGDDEPLFMSEDEPSMSRLESEFFGNFDIDYSTLLASMKKVFADLLIYFNHDNVYLVGYCRVRVPMS
jgi:hypothetical protein